MFSHFLASVFTESHQLTEYSGGYASQLNALRIYQRNVEPDLISLDVTKASGPDNIGNIYLKNLRCLSKSLRLIFQTCINKGKNPQLLKKCERSVQSVGMSDITMTLSNIDQ